MFAPIMFFVFENQVINLGLLVTV